MKLCSRIFSRVKGLLLEKLSRKSGLQGHAMWLIPFSTMLAALLCAPAYATNPPTISPSYRVFSTTQTASITATGGDSIYYTTDGSTPTTGSTSYSGSFSVASTTTIKAIAYDGVNTSTVTTSVVQ